MIYPWQQSQWTSLLARVKQGNLPHALFFSGAAGLGKLDFAREFSNYLCCEKPIEYKPCQHCNGCRLFLAGSHPDTAVVALMEKKKQIGVEQIRELGEFLSLTAHKAKQKIVIIENADKMNVNAANSLLKNLEEPSGSTLIMLISHRIQALPATLISRCQIVQFYPPELKMADQWLSAQGDLELEAEVLLSLTRRAPLAALAMSNSGQVTTRSHCFRDLTTLFEQQSNPIKLAATWSKCSQLQLFIWLQSWLSDMIKLKVTKDHRFVSNIDLIDALQTIADKISTRELFKSYDLVSESLRLTETQANSVLVLETLLTNLSCMRTR